MSAMSKKHGLLFCFAIFIMLLKVKKVKKVKLSLNDFKLKITDILVKKVKKVKKEHLFNRFFRIFFLVACK